MAFYTIKHVVDDVDADKLEPEFFDYVFNNKKKQQKRSQNRQKSIMIKSRPPEKALITGILLTGEHPQTS